MHNKFIKIIEKSLKNKKFISFKIELNFNPILILTKSK